MAKSPSLTERQDVKAVPLNLIAVEPFYGGSHRVFVDAVVQHSRHRWNLATDKAVHWKWRMRVAPLTLSTKILNMTRDNGVPDVLLCSDMVDIPQLRGFLHNSPVTNVPVVTYFHENQLTYPSQPGVAADFHYGYTNVLSALASDLCLFNSAFHRSDFLSAAEAFVRRMPDSQSAHDFVALRKKCQVVTPGFESFDVASDNRSDSANDPLTIGWVSRWEFDKRPELFLETLRLLARRGVDFRLILLGPRPPKTPESLSTIRDEFAGQILFDGYAESVDAYRQWLQKMDVVVSTADHEFFGIAVCEAVWAGAIPILPGHQSYPELFPAETLYDCDEHRTENTMRLVQWAANNPIERSKLARVSRQNIESHKQEHAVARLDTQLETVVRDA